MNNKTPQKNKTLISNSPQRTIQLGREIGTSLKGGEVIALVGPLGSGKTHLIKGIAAGLGLSDTDQVSSPTFVLVNEYTGPDIRLDIYHIDAYRLDSAAEFEKLGFDDLCYPGSVVLIEWADKVRAVLKNIDCIDIELSHISENKRKIQIS